MDEPRAQRTLVKSPPELWAEVSDVEALAGHLGAFGEIRITRLEPETTVAWEGDRARGTVELEPSGWGTKVTLTARMEGEREDEPEPVAAPEPVAPEVVVAEPGAEPAPEAATAAPEPEPEAVVAEPDAEPAPAAPEPEAAAPEPEAEPAPAAPEVEAAAPEPEPAVSPEPPKRRGLFARLFGRRRERTAAAPAAGEPAREATAVAPPPSEPTPAPRATAVAPPPPTPEPAPSPVPAASARGRDGLDAERAEAILVGVLDDLGAARHRPFSRG